MASTDFEAIGSAIYTALGGTAGTVYADLAGQGAQPPYIVYQREVGTDTYTFTSNGAQTRYVVKAISHAYWATEAQAMYAAAHALIQDAALSVTGYSTLRCRRVSTIKYQDSDKYWHVGGVYRIDIHAT